MKQERACMILIVWFIAQNGFSAKFDTLNGLSSNPQDIWNEVNISGNGLVVAGKSPINRLYGRMEM